jgi:hypothetical protein
MESPFSDITLYTPTPYKVGSTEYQEETALQNFVSDLYVQMMHGYKPPKTSRITLQPAYHTIWDRTWKNGSVVHIAPFYSYDEYKGLDKRGKYKYILDLIQGSMIQLSNEYGWDKDVFRKAYREIVENDFKFKIVYPSKTSKDKKKFAHLTLEKTETITSMFVEIENQDTSAKIKLFDKNNLWWYDCAYYLARYSKWFDSNRFGINYVKGKLEIFYSIVENEVLLLENGKQSETVNFSKYFYLE